MEKRHRIKPVLSPETLHAEAVRHSLAGRWLRENNLTIKKDSIALNISELTRHGVFQLEIF